jgi:Domain of unknown function (4846)
MLAKKLIILFLLGQLSSCGQDQNGSEFLQNGEKSEVLVSKINPEGSTIATRIFPLENYVRTKEDASSYGFYLRNLPLKPHGSKVKLYNGETKQNFNVYEAVVDLEIGTKDLHQCADAVMRLRAEYLWEQKRYDEIHFNLTNNFRVDYAEWLKGRRIVVKGNSTKWIEGGSTSTSYAEFWNYLELIFNYAGTLSLAQEMQFVSLKDLQIGDVFIRGGSPGHAVLVVDKAMNPETKEVTFLLAQSYMPAQEIQILQNPNNPELSPWYAISDIGDRLFTPEWTFSSDQLMRFRE